MNREEIQYRALAHGFTLREQSSGEMDLNEYVYAFAREMFEAGKEEAARRDEQSNAVVAFLIQYNRWRRGVDGEQMPDPRKIGETIDAAVKILEGIASAPTSEATPDCAGAGHARQQESEFLIGLRGCNSQHGEQQQADPCIYRMRTTDPGCTGCVDRDEDQSTEAED